MSIDLDKFINAVKAETVSVVDSGLGYANVIFKKFDVHTGATLAEDIQTLTSADITYFIERYDAAVTKLKEILPSVQKFEVEHAERLKAEADEVAAKAAEVEKAAQETLEAQAAELKEREAQAAETKAQEEAAKANVVPAQEAQNTQPTE